VNPVELSGTNGGNVCNKKLHEFETNRTKISRLIVVYATVMDAPLVTIVGLIV
jgi:hypothetical protein